MQGHRLGIRHKNNKPLISIDLWLLNIDATHTAGKIYVWKDANIWNDLNNFKG
jgi:hypothetical protein